MMSAYNLLNGIRTSENYDLLTGILRMGWGFEGAVTTDWDNNANQYNEIKAGNDIKMKIAQYEYTLMKVVWFDLREDIKVSAKRVLELILKID